MDIPSELKPDLHKALLGPLSIAEEIYGAQLPGCIFLLLLVLKENSMASKAFAYPFLGYKTKIVCGLLAAYFVGKVAMAIALLCEDAVRPKASPPDLKVLKGLSDESLYFLGGLVCNPLLRGKSPLFEYYAGFRAQTFFFLSSGLVLLAAAGIPGDGRFRLVEGLAGVVFLVWGVLAARKHRGLVAGMLGAAVGEALSGVPLDKILSGGITMLQVLPLVMAALNGETASKEKPAVAPTEAPIPALPTEPPVAPAVTSADVSV